MSDGPTVKWVSTDWLQGQLDALKLIDCQPNVHDYILGHIPGAIYLSEESLRLSRGGLPHVWLDDTMASSVLSTVGVDLERPIVVYGRALPGMPLGDGVPPLMVAYSLIRYGHEEVYVLQGGFDDWRQQEREVETRYPVIKRSRFVARTRNDLSVDYEEFRIIKERPYVAHIDSRAADQYAGSSFWPKRGHIPGALNIPWSEAFEVGNLCKLRDPNHMMGILERLDVTREKEVICHCGSGRKAAAQLCVLKWALGYPKVRLFEGSFTEWCSHQDNPTVIGQNPN
jgi:thiosulfate/3-mercaptopyruvate sulfurtransferase